MRRGQLYHSRSPVTRPHSLSVVWPPRPGRLVACGHCILLVCLSVCLSTAVTSPVATGNILPDLVCDAIYPLDPLNPVCAVG